MLNHNASWLVAALMSFALVGLPSEAFAVAKDQDKDKAKTADSVNSKVELDQKHPHYIRAVLISKITPYVYWQPSAFGSEQTPFNLCVFASDDSDMIELWPYLNLLKQQTSSGRPFNLINLSPYRDYSNQLPQDCHIYYFGDLRQKHAKALVEKAAAGSVLTIADSMEELYDGAMLAFIEERGRMKIYVNTDAITAGGLKIKSSLLRIAKKI